MGQNFYIRFSDCYKSEKVSKDEYQTLRQMAEFYKAVVKVSFHRQGRTLFVSFTKRFV